MEHQDSRGFATSPDAGRRRFLVRAFAPVAAAVVLFAAPAAAQAAFTAGDSAALSASTYSIPAPASVNAGIVCAANAKQATVTVAGYSAVARATNYQFTLTAPDGSSSTTATTMPTVALTQSSKTAGNRVYTLSVQALVGAWVGSPFTQSFTC
ncbi:hypothetical protein [Sinomonas sp. P47F7]|uniref:hypothetical protein n=1 Tax=Sinomonas sp. P47F7 TaxID=3410987 RepID=UPI003BF56B32